MRNNLRTGTVLITGASSGFGRAIAKSIAQRWPEAHLLLVARRDDRLKALAQEIGPSRTTIACIDVRVPKQIESLAGMHPLSKVTVLVNNAGLAAGLSPFQEFDPQDWEAMIDTNLKGLLYMTRLILPQMMVSGGGHIVNMGSVAGKSIYPKGHVYNASKFAVHALTEALRLDTLGANVRITEIMPGMAETEFSLVRFKGDSKKAKTIYDGMRALSDEDVADAVVWSLERPMHVNIQEIHIMPTQQATPRDVSRDNQDA